MGKSERGGRDIIWGGGLFLSRERRKGFRKRKGAFIG